MKKIVFVTPVDARYGFSLAGVRQESIALDQVTEILNKLTGDPTNGVVVVDERLIEGLGGDRFTEAEAHWPGLIVVLPAPEKAEVTAEDYALHLIRRAIGYQINLNL